MQQEIQNQLLVALLQQQAAHIATMVQLQQLPVVPPIPLCFETCVSTTQDVINNM
jgi:hypothetical protein